MSVGTITNGKTDTGCGCGGGDCGCGCGCGCVPGEFTRLRYPYGLRLGTVELSDEQAYLVGKHRFHNARLHGIGVLCGLRVDQYINQGSVNPGPSTVLRVTRGAALDSCGREVIVPVDQCIDVNAWFLKNKDALQLPDPVVPPAPSSLKMRVAVRYRECPSDPAPVPRDPCGCDAGGCDYTRVREGFELRLFAASDVPDCADEVFPSVYDLLTAIGVNVPPSPSTTPEAGLANAAKVPALPSDTLSQLDLLTAAGCPTAKNNWICLADFTATLDASKFNVVSITPPDNTIPGRHVVLSTTAIQTLVLGVAKSLGVGGLLGVGPTLGELVPDSAATPAAAKLNIAVNLITESNAAAPTALANFDKTLLTVFQLNGPVWKPVKPKSVTPSADTTQISVDLGDLTPISSPRYRLSIISPDANPIVDTQLRVLRPLNYSVTFQLGVDDKGKLTLTTLNV